MLLNFKTRNDATALDQVVLWRRNEMMVLFRGCPATDSVETLREAGVKIGLALSSSELSKVRDFDAYSHVFVSVRDRGRSILEEAVANLEGDSWSIDEDPA